MKSFVGPSRVGVETSKNRMRRRSRAPRHARLRGLEALESREVMATFLVTSLLDTGAGTLRQAILAANHAPGPDTIDFSVAGTIQVGRTSLPALTSPVLIDGRSAPGFAGTPVVTVNFQGTGGLQFNRGSDGSSLESLSLVGSGSAGVTLNASNITVQGDYIGVLANGATTLGNHGDGVRINRTSHGDLVGQNNPVSSVAYYDTTGYSPAAVTAWQGIRNGDSSGQYIQTGTSGTSGLLYFGPLSGVGGTGYLVDYPGATSTSVYGPNDLGGGNLQLVGTYRAGNGVVNGFLFQGTTADLPSGGTYTTIDYPGATYTFVHSTMGGLAVGNADGPEGNAPIGTGHAFIYDIATQSFLPNNIVYPGSLTTTAYGVWYNGGTSYTIAGGYIMPGATNSAPSQAYLVDYNSATGQFSHWTSFSDPNVAPGQSLATHFEGISSDQKGVYTLAADSVVVGSTNAAQGSLATVRRNPDGSFGPAAWVPLNYPAVPNGLTSANSVAGNAVDGIVITPNGAFPFESQVNVGFQLSNVISGNGGNGIGIYGASGNQIAMNNIGTDASGTIALGNRQNGILVTAGASNNLIGGQATGGNDPTAAVIVRPPQGNLISGNGGDGVLITGGATQNTLSGNFVGTSASGDTALGNRLDGVAVVNASGNALIGCTFQQSPFVFYNVLSGNGGNGLRITNSNNTTVQANFMGVGANNMSIVANGGDGLLVSGTSKNTQVGGVIPLGNVISGNNRNGIEVAGRASGLVSFNTFAGIYAFGGAAPNRQDGILVTSSGGNNQIRTCIVSGNLGNGIELGGNATGVQVTETAVGTNTSIQTAIANGGDGIKIDGNAHGNAIGGFQPSVEPRVTISSNKGYGVDVVGRARGNDVFNTYIGTNTSDTANLGNGLGGVFLGSGTSSTRIGGALPQLQVRIVNSGGAGVTMQGSNGNTITGDVIANNNGGGVVVIAGRQNQIGTSAAGNTIDGNGSVGVYASGTLCKTRVQGNSISGNSGNGVTLSNALGLTVGGGASGDGNAVVSNQGYGLFASGPGFGSVLQANTVAMNTQGNVNLTNSRGVKYIP